jgi:hypothetical protein
MSHRLSLPCAPWAHHPATWQQPRLPRTLGAGSKDSLLAGLASADADVWGTCPGAPILAAILNTCNEAGQAKCEADSRCSWSAARDPLNPVVRPCMVKPEALPGLLFNITGELQAQVKASAMAME